MSPVPGSGFIIVNEGETSHTISWANDGAAPMGYANQSLNDEFTTAASRAGEGINWLGLRTLYEREVRRFLKVSIQTVLAPVVSTLLFMMIFTLAFDRPPVAGVAFDRFIGPGLIMMGILTNAFANSSSSLIVAKIQGNSVDFLMPPLSPAELTAAFVAGAASRGLLVGAASAVGIALYSGPQALGVVHLWAVLYYGLMASVLLGAVGAVAGVWAEKFDHLAAVQNFVIMPLTFLSGTFYSIAVLPDAFQAISLANPFFYMIDGFRYGFTGYHDGSVWGGALFIGGLTLASVIASWLVFRSGWRMKS